MEQAADTAEAAAVGHYFTSPTENVLSQSDWTPGYWLIIMFCDASSVFQYGRGAVQLKYRSYSYSYWVVRLQ